MSKGTVCDQISGRGWKIWLYRIRLAAWCAIQGCHILSGWLWTDFTNVSAGFWGIFVGEWHTESYTAVFEIVLWQKGKSIWDSTWDTLQTFLQLSCSWRNARNRTDLCWYAWYCKSGAESEKYFRSLPPGYSEICVGKWKSKNQSNIWQHSSPVKWEESEI